MHIDLDKKIKALIELGSQINAISLDEKLELFYNAGIANAWFIPENLALALEGIAFMLQKSQLEHWLQQYQFLNNNRIPKKVGVIMAGNIPGVGMHDAIAVLLSGHILYAKLSKDDTVLMTWLLNKLKVIEPSFLNFIVYTDQLKDIEALIATGSDNSSRYFEYYFSKIPHIIRKNRTSLAILDGNESKDDIMNLGKDIFTYFGLGCRNISKLLIPQNYDLTLFFEAIYPFNWVLENRKYANNYEYNRAIYLMNQEEFLDNNFLLIKESTEMVSPIGVLYYSRYSNTDQVLDLLNENSAKIQCIAVSNPKGKEVRFGQAQKPNVWDYADGIDTLSFLENI